MSVTALAHGGHCGNSGVNYQNCSVDSCVNAGIHQHDNKTFDGHKFNCTASNCTNTNAHTHKSTGYYKRHR